MDAKRGYCVYVLKSKRNGRYYIGITPCRLDLPAAGGGWPRSGAACYNEAKGNFLCRS